jgi:hypothetical protein
MAEHPLIEALKAKRDFAAAHIASMSPDETNPLPYDRIQAAVRGGLAALNGIIKRGQTPAND